MKWYKTLQSRIFMSMLLLVALVSILIILTAFYQYKEQAEDYHLNRLERKESSVKRDIQYHLDNTTFFLIPEKLPYIFKEKIYEMSHVHNLEIGIYSMEGDLLKTSRASFQMDSTLLKIPKNILIDLRKDINHRVVSDKILGNDDYLSIYSYIYDKSFTPIGILHIPYLGKNNFYENELRELLVKFSFVFLFAVLVSMILAYFSSRLISNPLKEIIHKIQQTRLYKQNEKISYSSGSQELYNLIEAYNGMIDELEENATKLAQNERESAWREMAKQVAHEIKNPLTPMRLNIQNFERKFDPSDPQIQLKVGDLCHTLIQQIDVMSSIASAFSDFAKMPIAKNELINIVEVTQNAVDFFSEDYISFHTEKEHIEAFFDRNQLVRIITNLITNAQQALHENTVPKINIYLKELANTVQIQIEDNGKGIDEENKDKIFEPKFTTKSSGMGLGLAMVKNILEAYHGNISFVSKPNKGSTFRVEFPKK